jgi:hypothetical protein
MKSYLIAVLLAFLCICGVHYLTGALGLRILHNSIIDMALSALSGTLSIVLAQRIG